MSASPDDLILMERALRLGRRHLGAVWPNPSVGCVVVKEGRLIGAGVTAHGGRPHAETAALSMAGAAARGATAYVTLEPCAHTGRTPPCAQALIDAGVARVVTALEDPDPRVAGRGHAMLRGAGIDVSIGVGAERAAEDHQGFLNRITKGRPMVSLKLATTLDARIATQSGESRWITGAEARRMVHHLRATHDAVMIGGASAAADNPDLTIRHSGEVAHPLRLLLDPALRHAPMPRLVETARERPLWVLYSEAADLHTPHARAWEEAGARLLPITPDQAGRLSLGAALAALAREGLTRILVEGGGQLAAGLVQNDLVDELILFQAGKIIGGEGIPAIGATGLAALIDAPPFDLVSTRPIGVDLFSHWRRKR